MPDVTLKDVAREAGVNVSTVSRALSDDRTTMVKPATRALIQETAKRLGYRRNLQASALRRGRSGTVGVVVADLSNPFIGPTLRGITSALATRDELPFMAETGDSSERLVEVCNKLLSQQVDGIIVTAGRMGDQRFLRRIAKEVPLVLAVRTVPDSDLITVAHDDENGGRMAAEHLLGLGHRKLAQLCGPDNIYSFEARSRGFCGTAAAAGAECVAITSDEPLPNARAGSQLARNLLEQCGADMPTGLFAHNDTIAVGALAELRTAGFVCPIDISMVGYNDVPLTEYLEPPLTTIRLGGFELGRIAAEMLATVIEGERDVSRVVTLSPELIVRKTTGPAPELGDAIRH